MDELVNALQTLKYRVAGSEMEIHLEDECLHIDSNSIRHSLPLVRLYRPSSTEVREGASPGKVLVLTSASAKAMEAAAPFNHIVVPDGNFRLVLPGVALLRETAPPPQTKIARARLQGRTGLVAETLLLGGKRPWSVHELARLSGVSKGLTHRVLDRLEKENYLETKGNGPEKTRTLVKPTTLAETWSQEEAAPQVALRGYLYGASPTAIADKALQICPAGAIGGLLAANSYAPLLTRVPLPLRCWVPEGFWLGRFGEAGMEETAEGANLEIVQTKGDTWQRHRETLHRETIPLSHVSPWRAWREISQMTGRSEELAEELLQRLQTGFEAGASLLEVPV